RVRVSFPAPNFVFWSYAVSKNTQKAALGLLFAFLGFDFPFTPRKKPAAMVRSASVRMFVPLSRFQQLR
ncbi:hypothetical protein, partial [Pseudomonas psychrophila]|uniref:hypothetical protein n=1 Tax=Pseudomonas psychrophila TaxID=122355 RepID=UPI001969D926